MSLEVPDSDRLRVHMHLPASSAWTADQEEWVDDALQRATDLMQIATGLEDPPEDDLGFRVMEVGILAMAHAIYTTGGEDRDAMYSPFNSERLGSYSYSKALQAVQSRQATLVPEFDWAVAYFLSLANADGDSTAFKVEAEQVFSEPYSSSTHPERALTLSVDALSPPP